MVGIGFLLTRGRVTLFFLGFLGGRRIEREGGEVIRRERGGGRGGEGKEGGKGGRGKGKGGGFLGGGTDPKTGKHSTGDILRGVSPLLSVGGGGFVSDFRGRKEGGEEGGEGERDLERICWLRRGVRFL